jgi:NAD(P)-dependent dehydrogenase (short-subunit alcohol dehydrogenase family)
MNIIVNGGTRGIGKEVVLKLAQNINNLIITTGRNNNALDEISSLYDNIQTLQMDISVFDKEGDRFKEKIISHFNKVDLLINMSGMLISREFEHISARESRLMMETNFFGPAEVIRLIKPLMSKGSHILNISSMGGFQGSVKFKGLSYYSASKAAIACLSECLANEFTDDQISVNCLALGAVQTEMLEKAFPGFKAPVSAKDMAEFICDFALTGHKFFNGKVIPVAVGNP